MRRARHRHSTVCRSLALLTVGLLATAGTAIAVLTGSTQVLRWAVTASWLVALAIATYAALRGRRYLRDAAVAESTRRREQSLFNEQLEELQAGIETLTASLSRLNSEAEALRREVSQLRVEKAEADEIVRLAREERARAAAAEREANDQRMLTAAAFEAAAAVLESLGSVTISEQEPDWVTTWIANLGARGELDLTMHDDTIALELEPAATTPVSATA